MSSFATVLLLGSLAISTATRSITHLRHGGKMNPEAVAHTLVAVEGKWVTEAVAFAQCNVSDTACQEDTLGEFKKSCQTVVSAIIKSSSGDKSDVSEYFGDICEQPELRDSKKNFCNSFATALNGVLTDDSSVNRDELPVDTICANFLTKGFVKDAAKDAVARAEKEKQEAIAVQEEEEKKEAEEKAAAEAAEEKAKADEAAAEEKAKADEAAKKAAEEADEAAKKISEEADEASKKALEEVATNSTSVAAVAAVDATVAANATASVATVDSTASANSSAADSSVDASKDAIAANSTAVTPVPAQTATEVVANDTTAANTNATVVPSNNTK